MPQDEEGIENVGETFQDLEADSINGSTSLLSLNSSVTLNFSLQMDDESTYHLLRSEVISIEDAEEEIPITTPSATPTEYYDLGNENLLLFCYCLLVLLVSGAVVVCEITSAVYLLVHKQDPVLK